MYLIITNDLNAPHNQAQNDAKTRRDKVLSVEAEKVELLHGHSGDWQRIYYAILDTGNANVCTISVRTGTSKK